MHSRRAAIEDAIIFRGAFVDRVHGQAFFGW
ncbi:hypothetical protein F441_21789 [Phytophthora nicotianae CJ01A1]|uniref:Uncharacterized protein n=4 Tax=Phytophthora nicotianae TaxID=4792 RepID=V9DW27_PHYNI|nr:hypothetical protein F443_21905 [Phytophthora nicotianae P1569]ETL24907.1 hypothetical protein L916_21169 [Phytophthora nicotianae]ETP00883.1 hypothetical protein F441_21789 [Phytophthora nicotianae CJ01A1]ETP29028.1 hypothetical protein F442_21767 [Phytophthora nicotianae P10297]